MRRSERSRCPTVLSGRAKGYGAKYVGRVRLARDKKARGESVKAAVFRWPIIDGTKLNHHLLPVLKAMTQSHCAYCDFSPVSVVSNETIDHFKPKSTYPKLCCYWSNLYYSCDCCQAHKMEAYEAALLRPDAADYSFERYFLYDYASGEIQVNPAASEAEQRRAEVTITLLGLNQSGRPTARRREVRVFNEKERTAEEREEWAYRFALD